MNMPNELRTWILRERKATAGSEVAIGVLRETMEARDHAMRDEQRCEVALRQLEAGIVLDSLRGATGLADIFAECKNERQRDAALIEWRASDPAYIEMTAKLQECKMERSRLEADARTMELTLSFIKRDVDFSTAVVSAIGRMN